MAWASFKNVIALMAAPAVIAWLTAQFALTRFRSEKLWEKQLEMYRDIVEALHSSREFSSWHLDNIKFRQKPDEKEKEEVRTAAAQAHLKIVRTAEIGKLLISRQAIRRLERYVEEHDRSGDRPDWHDYLEEEYRASDSALSDFIKIARRDLKL